MLTKQHDLLFQSTLFYILHTHQDKKSPKVMMWNKFETISRHVVYLVELRLSVWLGSMSLFVWLGSGCLLGWLACWVCLVRFSWVFSRLAVFGWFCLIGSLAGWLAGQMYFAVVLACWFVTISPVILPEVCRRYRIYTVCCCCCYRHVNKVSQQARARTHTHTHTHTYIHTYMD